MVAGFLAALLGRYRASAVVLGGAAYEEQRAKFRRLESRGDDSGGDGFPALIDAAELGFADDETTAAWSVGDAPVWTGAAGTAAGSGRWGACLVGAGRSRWLLVLRFPRQASDVQLDLVLHALRSVLSSRLQQARWGSTMREAAAIQRSLLPSRAPRFPGFEIAGASHPAEEVGGDFWDAIEITESSLGLAIGDASGHGLPAALVARDAVVGLRMGMSRELRIGPVIERLNRIIHRGGPSSSFVSLFYGELEDNGNFFYVNCGHKAPLLFRAGAGQEAPPESLASGDIVLGPVPDARFKRQFVHIAPGDVLLLYTDGVNERRNAPGEQFGDARIARAAQAAAGRGVRSIVEAVVSAAAAWGDTAAWSDDATVVGVAREPARPPGAAAER